MIRRLFTLLSAVSLLLCVATCALWARSYRLSDQVKWDRIDGVGWIRTAEGHVMSGLFVGNHSGGPADYYGLKYASDRASPPLNGLVLLNHDAGDTDFSWERGGFAWYEMRAMRGNLHAIAVAPFWAVAGVTAVLPLGWFAVRRRIRSRRRERSGLCPACGYDLRASPGRCPECGADPSDPAPTGRKPHSPG
jgi:hypothetical protein